MKRITKSYRLFFQNIRTILLFELIYKIITFAILSPALSRLYYSSLRYANISYLTNSTFFDFITKPTTLGCLCLMFILSSFFSSIEISSIIYCFDLTKHKQPVSLFTMLRYGLTASLRILYPKNIGFFLLNLFMIPLSSISLLSSYIFTLKVPDFVWNFATEKPIYTFLFLFAFLMICLAAYCCCFCMHYFILEHTSFKKAIEKSWNLLKTHKFSTFACFLLFNMAALFILAVFIVICVGIAILGVHLLASNHLALAIVLGIARGIVSLAAFFLSCFLVPLTFSFFSQCFYLYKKQRREHIYQLLVPSYSLREKKIHSRYLLMITIFALVSISVYASNGAYQNLSNSTQFWNTPTISAHRGDSIHAPENTLPAFEAAVENMADCIELDIQQTKDGHLIVLHDTNLKRTTGFNANVWDVNYSTVKQLDAGSWFAPEFKGTTIPTFTQVLAFAKEHHVMLNIDVKSTGHEKNLISTLVKQIESFEYENYCIVTSFEYPLLQEVKSLNPNIRTGYLLKAAFQGIASMEDVDAFSINYCFITRQLVDSIHKKGKEVYAWTVNDDYRINAMIYADVDNIITDKPVSVKEQIHAKGRKDYLIQLITFLMS